MEINVPTGVTLFDYQKEGVRFLMERNSSFLADEMGLGKTVQVIAYMNMLKPKRTLIVCPSSLKINWSEELSRFSTDVIKAQIISSGKESKLPFHSKVVIASYDIVAKHIENFLSYNYDLVVLDESHYIKDYKTKRTKNIKKIESINKVALTGTPILNRPVEIYETLKWLDSNLFPNFFDFANKYCFNSYFSGPFLIQDFSGARNLDELNEILTSTLLLRRLKADVLSELPEKTRQIIQIDGLSATQESISSEIIEEIEKLSIAQERKKEFITEILKKIAIERHEIALKKVKFTLQYIEDLLLTVEKIVLFAHHLDVIELLSKGLNDKGIGNVSYTGRMRAEEKDSAIKKFQETDEIKVFIGSIRSSSVGITLTAASVVVFHELDFTPGIMIQAEDRIHRIGQKKNILIQHIVFRGGIDSYIAKLLIHKQEIFNQLFKENQEVLGNDLNDSFLANRVKNDQV